MRGRSTCHLNLEVSFILQTPVGNLRTLPKETVENGAEEAVAGKRERRMEGSMRTDAASPRVRFLFLQLQSSLSASFSSSLSLISPPHSCFLCSSAVRSTVDARFPHSHWPSISQASSRSAPHCASHLSLLTFLARSTRFRVLLSSCFLFLKFRLLGILVLVLFWLSFFCWLLQISSIRLCSALMHYK